MMPSASSEKPHIKLEDKETSSMMLKVGPYSGREPNTFSNDDDITVWDEKGRTQIAQMFVSYGDVINSIAFQYIEDDKLVTSPLFGSQTLEGLKFAAVTFNDGENEYITRISGSHEYENYGRIHKGMTSLTIETNAGSYGPFGKSEKKDTIFEYSFGPKQFGGFHGLSTPDFLTSIGVYVKPIDSMATLRSTRTQLLIEWS